MTIQPGDLVSVAGRPGVWAVIEPLPSPRADRWRVAQTGRLFDAGEAGMTLLERPSFTPGDAIRHSGRPATVVADDGGELVRIWQEQRRPLRGGGAIVTEGPVDAFRWALALENA